MAVCSKGPLCIPKSSNCPKTSKAFVSCFSRASSAIFFVRACTTLWSAVHMRGPKIVSLLGYSLQMNPGIQPEPLTLHEPSRQRGSWGVGGLAEEPAKRHEKSQALSLCSVGSEKMTPRLTKNDICKTIASFKCEGAGGTWVSTTRDLPRSAKEWNLHVSELSLRTAFPSRP